MKISASTELFHHIRPFGAIHLQLSAQLTDVVCRKRYRFYEMSAE